MKLPRWGWPLLIALLLIIVALVGARIQPVTESQMIACADPVRGCDFKHRGETVQVRFSHPPKPLEAFAMTVYAPGARNIQAEFKMQGMKMELSPYILAIDKTGVFTGQILLPICVSGRRDWKLFLQIDAQRYTIPFSTL